MRSLKLWTTRAFARDWPCGFTIPKPILGSLWLVPARGKIDKADFYRRIAQIVSKQRAELGGIDASDTEMILDSHPAIAGLSRFIRAPGLNSINFAGNRFNGYYLPKGIILRADFSPGTLGAPTAQKTEKKRSAQKG
jgi:hypothetical protein